MSKRWVRLFSLFLCLGLLGPGAVFSQEENPPEVVGVFSISSEDTIPFSELTQVKDGTARDLPGWRAMFSRRTERIMTLFGPGTPPYKGGPGEAALTFAREFKGLLGMSDDEDFAVLRTMKALDKLHVRLQQTYKGVPVEGGHVLVHMTPDGSVTMVQNGSVDDPRPSNSVVITEQEAVDSTMKGLREELGEDVFMADPQAQLVIAQFSGRYLYAWRVAVPTGNPIGHWITYLDAESRAVLLRYNDIYSLKKGKGYSYRNNNDALINNYRKTTLKNLFTEAELNSMGYTYGYPIGQNVFAGYTDGASLYYGWAFAPDHKFYFDPFTSPNAFTEVHTYYHIDTTHTWWSKKVIKDKMTGEVIPYFNDGFFPFAAVNTTGLCNAYYTPSLLGWGPGFVFGNENSCGSGSRDLADDAGVIYHEFTHAVEDWQGTPFNSAPNHYPRAMGEGNADYFSCTQRNSPLIGNVFDPPPGAYGLLRDLSGHYSGQRLYPDDVDHPAWALPEEHYTGEIWGQTLWDLRRVLKKKADIYIRRTNVYYLANLGGHHTTDIDFFDWAWSFYHMLLDVFGQTKGLKTFFKCYSVFTDRGIFTRKVYSHPTNYFYSGSGGSDNAWMFIYNFLGKGSWKSKGHLWTTDSDPATGNPSEYAFRLQYPASEVRVLLKSKGTDLFRPNFVLRQTWSPTTIYAPYWVSMTDYMVKAYFAGLPTNTLLSVEVYSDAGDTGAYILKIQAK